MIVKRALEEPIREIVQNAGLEGSVIVEKVKAERCPDPRLRRRVARVVDMIQAGIIDPTKVERVALQNAASVASLLPRRGAGHRPARRRSRPRPRRCRKATLGQQRRTGRRGPCRFRQGPRCVLRDPRRLGHPIRRIACR